VERYCTVRVKWNGGEPDDEQIARPGTFDEVVATLKQVRDRHANEYADSLADDQEAARSVRGDVLGGFGVELTNRWGGVVEVGPGRDVWFFFRHEPPPAMCYTDRPPIDGTRVCTWTAVTTLSCTTTCLFRGRNACECYETGSTLAHSLRRDRSKEKGDIVDCFCRVSLFQAN
jgi:hypothetical protein